MQISAISPSFNGRRDNIDAAINLDDRTIIDMAYIQTASKYNHKKSRRITNALFYSAPIAAGLATAVLSKGGTTKIFSKQVSGLAARAAAGTKIAAGWTAALASIDLLGFAKNKLAENSQEVRKFDREHPILSLGMMLAAGIGAICLVSKGATQLGKFDAPKFLQKFAINAEKFLNKNETIQAAKTKLLKLADKTPAALKDIGATALSWSPTVLLFGGLFHSIGSASKENREFYKNYTQLKDRQAVLAQARMRELSIQNDILMQDVKNKEEIALMNNPILGMPPEVIDKIA